MAVTLNASTSPTTGLITTADSSGAITLQTNGTDALALVSGAVVNPTIKNYVESPVTANTGTAYTIDLTNGTIQILTLTGNCTFTFPTATSGKSFAIFLRQDATGSRTVTWAASVKWPGGTAPTITATASRQDIYSFFADGTNWYGVTIGQNYTP